MNDHVMQPQNCNFKSTQQATSTQPLLLSPGIPWTSHGHPSCASNFQLSQLGPPPSMAVHQRSHSSTHAEYLELLHQVIHGDPLWSRIQGIVVGSKFPFLFSRSAKSANERADLSCVNRCGWPFVLLAVCIIFSKNGLFDLKVYRKIQIEPDKIFVSQIFRYAFSWHSPGPIHSPALLHWSSLAQLPHHLCVSNEVVASSCGRITSLSTMNIMSCKKCLLSAFSLVPASKDLNINHKHIQMFLRIGQDLRFVPFTEPEQQMVVWLHASWCHSTILTMRHDLIWASCSS